MTDDASIVVVIRVHELKTAVDRKFDAVEQQFVDLRAEMDRRFSETDLKIESEGARTRRHFDVVAEHFKAEVQTIVDVIADAQKRSEQRVAELDSKGTTLYTALDDHELRLRILERKRRTG